MTMTETPQPAAAPQQSSPARGRPAPRPFPRASEGDYPPFRASPPPAEAFVPVASKSPSKFRSGVKHQRRRMDAQTRAYGGRTFADMGPEERADAKARVFPRVGVENISGF